ncbi:nuclear transport factor 2 family protein [Streptomyces capitiformicae]|uniref:SnoaL-like domain-containing protein n=1 Tax=Streptomyces capitiformicae TaxID=2014920 RepID=A0A919DJ54_9ACTN|nr:nuclear transport factor 2 family protein [Streptomyces capitiformicae]GHE46925.1 hypothetical protein GCM10017771_67810 [Streptomyces capitiformicae]
MKLEELADRLEIIELYGRYVHAADAKRADLLDEVFLPDCVIDYTDAGLPAPFTWEQGRDGGFLTGEGFDHVFHISVNQVIDFEDDERTISHVKAKTINPWARRNDQGEVRAFQVQGWHTDVLVKTGKGWRFQKRRWTTEWVSGWFGDELRVFRAAAEMMD